jgi:hypothetical protein
LCASAADTQEFLDRIARSLPCPTDATDEEHDTALAIEKTLTLCELARLIQAATGACSRGMNLGRMIIALLRYLSKELELHPEALRARVLDEQTIVGVLLSSRQR